MKKINFWAMFTLLFVAFVPLFTSCTEETVDDGDGDGNTSNASVSFKQSEIAVSADETVYKMGYTITNAGEDFIVEGNSENDWISNFKTSTKNVLEFTISKNEGEAREGKVELLYICGKDSARASFAVKQEAAKEEEFALSIGETGSSWAKFTLAPKDKNMKYMLSSMEADVMDGYVSDEALLNDEMKNYKDIADYYGMTITEVLESMTYNGELSGVAFIKLDADKEYYAYCYGFDSSWSIVTSVVKKKFKTTEAGPVDLAITFDVTSKAYEATVDINATTPDSYALYLANTSELEGKGEEELKELLLGENAVLFADSQEGLSLTGLLPDTETTLLAMGRVGNVATTKVYRHDFKTTPETVSNVELELDVNYCDAAEFNNLYPIFSQDPTGYALLYGIINFNPEADAQSYKMLLFEEDLAASGATDNDIRQYAIYYGEYQPLLTGYPYNTNLYVYAVAYDKNGNYGPLMKETINMKVDENISVTEMAKLMGIIQQSRSYVAPWLKDVKMANNLNKQIKKIKLEQPKIEKNLKSLRKVAGF